MGEAKDDIRVLCPAHVVGFPTALIHYRIPFDVDVDMDSVVEYALNRIVQREDCQSVGIVVGQRNIKLMQYTETFDELGAFRLERYAYVWKAQAEAPKLALLTRVGKIISQLKNSAAVSLREREVREFIEEKKRRDEADRQKAPARIARNKLAEKRIKDRVVFANSREEASDIIRYFEWAYEKGHPFTVRDVAYIFSVRPDLVRKCLKRHSDIKNDAIARARSSGKSVAEVARMFDMSRRVVIYGLKKAAAKRLKATESHKGKSRPIDMGGARDIEQVWTPEMQAKEFRLI